VIKEQSALEFDCAPWRQAVSDRAMDVKPKPCRLNHRKGLGFLVVLAQDATAPNIPGVAHVQ
jgi:hypothetical protein